MKILFYISTIRGGGAARVMVNLANALSATENITLITNFKSEVEYDLNDKVQRISIEEHEDKSNVLVKNFRRIRTLKKLIKTINPDLCVSFMGENNFRLLLAENRKIKKIISVRNDPNREYSNAISRFLAKTLYKKADGIVFQTEDAKKWFPKKIQDKSTIIFNQVDTKFYEVQRCENPKDIITTGRLFPQKNHEMLIKAFAKISDKIEDNLIIYGEGDLREHLQNLINSLNLSNRVFLPGASKNVPEVLSKAKLFVLSSDYEGMPNSLLEAMAAGVPCISTDCPCGGPRMVIDNHVNGVLVPVNDENLLAKEMFNLIKNSEKLEKIHIKSKKIANSFRPDYICTNWLMYFNKISGK